MCQAIMAIRVDRSMMSDFHDTWRSFQTFGRLVRLRHDPLFSLILFAKSDVLMGEVRRLPSIGSAPP